jgi:hypothetical protein
MYVDEKVGMVVKLEHGESAFCAGITGRETSALTTQSKALTCPIIATMRTRDGRDEEVHVVGV